MTPLDRGPATIEFARALRLDERYAEAEAAALRALRDVDADTRRLLEAEIARLAYYVGRFSQGADAAQRLIGPNDLASARAATAASVNLLALNKGHTALRQARDAILRLRVLGGVNEDTVDAQIQLVHVLAHMGSHREAEISARSALAQARTIATPREVARAEYALGFALWFGGSEAAVDRLLSAESMARERAGPAWQWILFCLAACLRDLGYLEPADAYVTQSGVALRYERAWFQIRARQPKNAAAWIRPPIGRDEIPFLRAISAAIRVSSRVHARQGATLRTASKAAEEFGRTGLDHWRWGALWIAAADTTAPPSIRQNIVLPLLDSLTERGAINWGFYDPDLPGKWARASAVHPLLKHLLDVHRRRATKRNVEVALLLPSLRLLNPEAIAVLSENGLSPAEIRTVTAALELWLERGTLHRGELAARLGLSVASVRTRVNHIRQKMNLVKARGAEPMVSWLAERELLAPTTERRVILRLARK